MRLRLPSRRASSNYVIEFSGQQFAITVGFYPDGKPGEVFANAGKTPQAVQQIIADTCILISIALQHGVPAEDLGKSLAYFDDGKPYTVIGAICTTLTTIHLGDENENNQTGGDSPR